MMLSQPEPWLRGPLPGISESLQPVAHALTAAFEDVTAAASGLGPAEVWAEPGGAPSVGFHLMHLAGSTDRLCTYARGARLSEAQKAALAAERACPEPRPAAADLLGLWREVVDRVMRQLADTPDSELSTARLVGRAQLPSSVRGLLLHAAEHAQRHTGQIITTAKVVRGLG